MAGKVALLGKDQIEIRVLKAKEHINSAANMLRGLNADMERVAWILEDALTFIDDAREVDQSFIEDVFADSAAQFVPPAPAAKQLRRSKLH
ncbi:MAG: hypothetical protein IT292_11360 [Deltaproteobacteria bacterium]|nr:hypothetical protein [Deltaproteobacteria bacterium]